MEIIAIAALALAALFGFLVWKLLREERRRAEARVASLTAALEGRPDLPLIVPVDDDSGAFRAFGAEDGRDGLRRLVALAPLALVVMVGVGYLWFGRDVTPRPASNSVAATNGPREASAPDAPLELLSLTHTQRDGLLSVRGIVRNPVTAPGRPRLDADVVLLDAEGQSLGSARAPVRSTELRPGDEAAFVVNAPWQKALRRYRVTFRVADGPAVAHVDRRDPVAQGAR